MIEAEHWRNNVRKWLFFPLMHWIQTSILVKVYLLIPILILKTNVENIMHEKLNRALTQLSEEEIFLIEQLYYLNQSERKLAEILKLSQNAIHKRKHKF